MSANNVEGIVVAAADADADAVLSDLLGASFAVTQSYHSTARPHPKFAGGSSGERKKMAQDRRRKEVLKYQKKRRDDFVQLARALAEGNTPDDDAMDEEGELADEDMEDASEEALEAKFKPRRMRQSYKNQLMLSEWLVDVPADLASDWLMVKVPEGKRCLVVAGRGETKAFLKSGFKLFGYRGGRGFPSLLPGGNFHSEENALSTPASLLDCIYSPVSRVFYVIDVMVLKGYSYYECETELRFSHGKKRLFEESGAEIGASGKLNPYAFVPLPHYSCQTESLEAGLADEAFPSSLNLDGLLFYHKRVHYLPGETPLVGWLKGFMTDQVLGVPAPDNYKNQAPAGYVSQEKFISDYNEERKEIIAKRKEAAANRKRFPRHEDMDCGAPKDGAATAGKVVVAGQN